ncbi:MAG: FkbM family methyltransferase [Candidatus Omnitrophota bacterium]
MKIMEYARKIKNKLVPQKTCFRKIMFGICKGYKLQLDLSFQFRCFIGFYETEIAGFIKKYVESGYCCYDIGASSGYWSIALSSLAAPGRIYSFEADRKYADLLDKTISRNKTKSEITVFNNYVGNLVNGDTNSISIDHLVYENNLPKPDFIKMDIEGAEYDAFLGAMNVLKQFSPKIVAEVHSEDLRDNCRDLLEKIGYDVNVVDQNTLLTSRGNCYNGWLCCKKP